MKVNNILPSEPAPRSILGIPRMSSGSQWLESSGFSGILDFSLRLNDGYKVNGTISVRGRISNSRSGVCNYVSSSLRRVFPLILAGKKYQQPYSQLTPPPTPHPPLNTACKSCPTSSARQPLNTGTILLKVVSVYCN